MLANVADVLLALLDAHPDGPVWARPWLTQTLQANLEGYAQDSETQLRGWSVGAAWGNETLVQSRPIVRNQDIDLLDDLLRTPASCVIAALSVAAPGMAGLVAPATARLSRFRRWLGVRVGASLAPPTTQALRAELPDFLARHQVDRGDGELVFLSFLSQLHALGGLRKTYSPPEVIRQALLATARRIEISPHNLMVSDGRTFAMLHDGGALLSFEPPPEQTPRDRFRLSGDLEGEPRTNLLLHVEELPADVPRHGGERIAAGVFSVDLRTPRALTR